MFFFVSATWNSFVADNSASVNRALIDTTGHERSIILTYNKSKASAGRSLCPNQNQTGALRVRAPAPRQL